MASECVISNDKQINGIREDEVNVKRSNLGFVTFSYYVG